MVMIKDYMGTFPPDSYCEECGREMYEDPNELCVDCLENKKGSSRD